MTEHRLIFFSPGPEFLPSRGEAPPEDRKAAEPPPPEQNRPPIQREIRTATTRLSQPEAVARARNRFVDGLREDQEPTDEQIRAFHDAIRLDTQEEETVGEHFMRVSLGAGRGPKPLVVLFMGNGEMLRNESQGHTPRDMFENGDMQRGMTYLFDRFARNQRRDDVDVIVFRVGDTRTNGITQSNPLLKNEYAYTIAQNVIQDALKGRGVFAGRQYNSVVGAGYSHGGGFLNELAREQDWRALQRDPDHPVPLLATATLDAIQHRGDINTRPIDSQPESSRSHLHLYQNRGAAPGQFIRLVGAPLRGGDTAAPAGREVRMPVTASSTGRDNLIHHRRLANANAWGSDNVLNDIYNHLRTSARNGLKPQGPQLADSE